MIHKLIRNQICKSKTRVQFRLLRYFDVSEGTLCYCHYRSNTSPTAHPHSQECFLTNSNVYKRQTTRKQRIPKKTTAPRATTIPFWQFFRATIQETKTSIAGDLILNHLIPPIIGTPQRHHSYRPQDFTEKTMTSN